MLLQVLLWFSFLILGVFGGRFTACIRTWFRVFRRGSKPAPFITLSLVKSDLILTTADGQLKQTIRRLTQHEKHFIYFKRSRN